MNDLVRTDKWGKDASAAHRLPTAIWQVRCLYKEAVGWAKYCRDRRPLPGPRSVCEIDVVNSTITLKIQMMLERIFKLLLGKAGERSLWTPMGKDVHTHKLVHLFDQLKVRHSEKSEAMEELYAEVVYRDQKEIPASFLGMESPFVIDFGRGVKLSMSGGGGSTKLGSLRELCRWIDEKFVYSLAYLGDALDNSDEVAHQPVWFTFFEPRPPLLAFLGQVIDNVLEQDPDILKFMMHAGAASRGSPIVKGVTVNDDGWLTLTVKDPLNLGPE